MTRRKKTLGTLFDSVVFLLLLLLLLVVRSADSFVAPTSGLSRFSSEAAVDVVAPIGVLSCAANRDNRLVVTKNADGLEPLLQSMMESPHEKVARVGKELQDRLRVVDLEWFHEAMTAWRDVGLAFPERQRDICAQNVEDLFNAIMGQQLVPNQTSYALLIETFCLEAILTGDATYVVQAQDCLSSLWIQWNSILEQNEKEESLYRPTMSMHHHLFRAAVSCESELGYLRARNVLVGLRGKYAHRARQPLYKHLSWPGYDFVFWDILTKHMCFQKFFDFREPAHPAAFSELFRTLAEMSIHCFDREEKTRWDQYQQNMKLVLQPLLLCWQETTKHKKKGKKLIRGIETQAIRDSHRAFLEWLKPFKEGAASPQTLQPPDRGLFHIVLSALGYVPSRREAGMAEYLLWDMWKLHERYPDAFAMPTIVEYGLVMRVWGRSYYAMAGIQAERLLDELWDKQDERFQPTVVQYNDVVLGWANSNRHNAGHRANALLKSMWELYHHHKGDASLKPDRTTYDRVIQAWRKSGGEKQAMHLLREMWDLHDLIGDSKPTENTYKQVMSTMHGPDAGEHAEALLREMLDLVEKRRDDTLRPSDTTYNEVILAWGRSGSPLAGIRSKALLHESEQRIASRNRKPRRIVYQNTMAAFISSGQLDAGEQAEDLLRSMWKMFGAGMWHLKPTATIYRLAMEAWSLSNDEDAGERTDTLLQEMWHRYRCGSIDLKPTPECYSQTVQTLIVSDQPERAYQLLDELWFRYDRGDSSFQPTQVGIYKAVVDGWARKKDKMSGFQSELLLNECWERHNDEEMGQRDMRPDKELYNAVLKAWVASGAPEAEERSLALLRDMWRSCDNDYSLTPDVDTYNLVIRALSPDKNMTVPQKAEMLLRERPDHDLYKAVIQTWSESKASRGGERAEALLTEMWDGFQAGNNSLRPGMRLHNLVLYAWARSKGDDVGYRAEAFYQNMLRRRRLVEEPNNFTISCLIRAWKSVKGMQESGERAERWLKHAWNQYQCGNTFIKPNLDCYHFAIGAWASSDRPDAGEKADRLLDEFRRLLDQPPRETMLGAAIHAWSRSKHPNAGKRADELLEETRKRFTPTTFTYTAAINAWAVSGSPQAGERAQALLEEMDAPNALSYAAAMRAWSDGERAEALLQEMWDRHHHEGWKHKPDQKCYHAAMTAWKGTPERVQRLYEDLLTRQKRGDLPNDSSRSIAVLVQNLTNKQ